MTFITLIADSSHWISPAIGTNLERGFQLISILILFKISAS